MINFLDEAKLHINIFCCWCLWQKERSLSLALSFLVIVLATINLIFSNKKIKNIKLMTFFQVTIKNMACSIGCEVSFYLHRRYMSICCETITMTDEIARKLLKSVDWLMDEHFFQTNCLRQLGWCAHYMLDRRSLKYIEDKKELLRKTELTQFYWFNKSPNRAFKRQLLTKTEVCNCMYWQFFMSWFLEIKQNDF